MTDESKRVTLACGEAVFNTDPRWLAECQARHRHVLSLRHLNVQARRDYLANVERAEGALSAVRLKEAFTADWNERKAAAEAAKEKAA